MQFTESPPDVIESPGDQASENRGKLLKLTKMKTSKMRTEKTGLKSIIICSEEGELLKLKCHHNICMYISSLSRTGRGQTKVEMGLGSETQGGTLQKSELITLFEIKNVIQIFNNN